MEIAGNVDLKKIAGILEENYGLYYEGNDVDWKDVCDRIKSEMVATCAENLEEDDPLWAFRVDDNHPAGMHFEEYEELRPDYEDEMPSFGNDNYPPGFDPEPWDL